VKKILQIIFIKMNIDSILLSEFQKLSESCESKEEYTKFIERWILIWKKIYKNNKLIEKKYYTLNKSN